MVINIASEKGDRMRELIFFVFFGSLSVVGIIHNMYFWHLVDSVRLSMAYSLTYLHIIKPLTIMCVALLIAGILTKCRIFTVDRLSSKAKRILLVTGIVIISLTIFYTIVFIMYITIGEWNLAIHDLIYLFLTPFSTMNFYEESLVIRNLIYMLGALALFFAKTTLGNEGSGKFRDEPMKKQHAHIKYTAFWGLPGLIIIAGMIHYIYLRVMIEKIGVIDSSIRPNAIAHFDIIRPLMVMSIVLLIASVLKKIKLLAVENVSPKAKKILLVIGVIFMATTILYMFVNGIFVTGMQYAEKDNWVKSLIRSEFFTMLQAPFRTYYFKESLIIRDIIAAIGVIAIFLAKRDEQNEIAEVETLKVDDSIR